MVTKRKQKKRSSYKQAQSRSGRRRIPSNGNRTGSSETNNKDLLQDALKLHKSGNITEAARLYHKILEKQPEHVDANFLMGTLNLQQRNLDLAATFLKRAIKLKPDYVTAHNNLGIVLQNQGKLDEAAKRYKKAIVLNPNYAHSHNNLGIVLQAQGKTHEATASHRKAIEGNPNHAEMYYNLGNVLKEQESLDEAVENYRQAIKLKPDYAEAYSNLGSTLQAQGNLCDAIENYNKTIKVKPDYAEAYYNLGTALQEQDKLDEAMLNYNRTVKVNPDFAKAYYNIGTVLQKQGKLDEAISSYQKALEIKPDYAKAYNNMGNVLKLQEKLDEAICSYKKALEIEPDFAEVHNNMGGAILDHGNPDDAISCFQKALEIKPGYTEVYSNMGNAFNELGNFNEALSSYQNALRLKPDLEIEARASIMLPVINESKESIYQHRNRILEQIDSLRNKGLTLEDPYKQIGSTNYYLAYHGLNDKEIQKEIASFYINACPDLVWTSPNLNQQQTDGKIKIGIISTLLFNHTIGKLNYGIIKYLSREKFHVKLFRFSGENEDHLSKAINEAADEVIILPKKLKPARQEIAEHSLDILFYLDIGMNPLTYFLAFSRLAPVQCVTWGHPVTTGIPNMDYFISSDKSEPPGAEDHYSERLILQDRLTTYYYRPELPEKPPSREKLGLPENYNLYVCPQTLFKFHPDFDDVLGALLRQDTRGILVLIEGKHKHWVKLLHDRFSRVFPDVIDRVRFLPSMSAKDFLSLLMVADVNLDTPYFGGGNTSLESFACGVPVVTWPGEFMRDRLTLALYKQMGIMDCVADNAQSYLDIAFRLANDKTWREEIRDKIKANSDCLFEDIKAVHELERFFEMAVEELHKENAVLLNIT